MGLALLVRALVCITLILWFNCMLLSTLPNIHCSLSFQCLYHTVHNITMIFDKMLLIPSITQIGNVNI